MKKLQEVLQEVHAEVRKNLGVAQATTKRDYDVKARVTSFEVGDLVYRQNTAHRAGLSRKLCPTYRGPYLVVEVHSPYLYCVEDRKWVMVLHHDKLKLCHEREIPMWIRRRRHVLLGKRDTCAMPESVTDIDVPEDGVLDELPFPDGVPTPEFSDESGLSSELYQAQTDNSQAGDCGQGSGLMRPELSSELYQDSSNLDPERRPYGYSETDADITLPYVIDSEDPLSQALDNSDDDRGELRTMVRFTCSGREV